MNLNQDVVFSEYLLGRLRLGYDYLAVFLAAALFERVINRKLENQDPVVYFDINNDREIELASKINLLNEATLRQDSTVCFEVFGITYFDQVKSKLHKFRQLRNDLVHANQSIDRMFLSEKRKSKLTELVFYLVAELSPELFKKRIGIKGNGKLKNVLGCLDEIQADYLIREVDETMIRRYDHSLTADKKQSYFSEIELSDFNNLFAMRKKLVYLKYDLRRWLAHNTDIPSRHLNVPVISTLDTTSGYVWMPIVYDFKQLVGVERPNIEMPSATILATPLDFRIYIDFGGKAMQSRQRFLDFLEGDEDGSFAEFIKLLGEKEQSHFWFFDVEWYSHIIKKTPLSDIQSNPELLSSLIAEAKASVATKTNGNGIQTSGSMLCGFIFGREEICKDGLNKDKLFQYIELILDLYYRFLMFDYHNI